MTLEDNVGFFFSCYKENRAVEFCINNIREHYPNNPIYISSDGGSDFSYLCDDASICKVYDDVLGYVNHPETKDTDRLIDCCKEFLKRIKDASEYCKTEYIVYYEPDILLRGKIKTQDHSDLTGSFANPIHQETISLIKKYNPDNSNYNFGACGGSVIKVSSLENVLEKTTDPILKDLIYTDKRISNCDYLLTVLFSIFGYSYLENMDFIEAKRDHNWESTDHSIVHQYHKNYLENYNGKYENA